MNLKAFTFLMVLITLIANIGWAEDQTSIVESGEDRLQLDIELMSLDVTLSIEANLNGPNRHQIVFRWDGSRRLQID